MQPPDPLPTSLPGDVLGHWPHLCRVGQPRTLREYVGQIVRYREFALTVPLGELRSQNQDTVLGQAWHLLNPLLLVGVYWLIFDVFLDVSGRGNVDNYLAFLVVGVVVFNYTRTSVQAGASTLVKNRKLLQSIVFPRFVLPASAVVSQSVTFLVSLPVVALLLVGTGVRPSWGWLLVFPLMAIQLVFNLGIAAASARATFHFRDFQQVLPYGLRIGFYVSGVLIPLTSDLVKDRTLLLVLQSNPMYAFIEAARAALLDGRFDGRLFLWCGAWALGSVLVGFFYFRRAEHDYGRV